MWFVGQTIGEDRKNGRRICDVTGYGGEVLPAQAANARLIAAAPELCAVVVEFVRICDDEPTETLARRLVELRTQARAALAKARGEA